MTEKNENQQKREKWKKGMQTAYGEDTMHHGYFTLPSEYTTFLWPLHIQKGRNRVTPREYLTILGILATNNLEREVNHEPAFISQAELGARQGIKGAAISQIYGRLEVKTFCCPYPDCDFSRKGYVKRESGKRTEENLEGSDYVWTDGIKEVINHLASHYNQYILEYGHKEGLEKYKEDRDALIAGSTPKWRKKLGRHAWMHTERAQVWLQNQGVEPEFITASEGDF